MSFKLLSNPENNNNNIPSVDEPADDELSEPWRDPQVKTLMLQKIKTKKSQGLIDPDAKVTEKLIASEYVRHWLTLPVADHTLKLLTHPLLINKDKKKIDEIVDLQKTSQLKVATGLTAGTSAIYWVYLSRKDAFYGFFNNKNSYRGTNIAKKLVGLYGVWIGWIIVLNMYYKEYIFGQIKKQNLFAKYNVSFEKRTF